MPAPGRCLAPHGRARSARRASGASGPQSPIDGVALADLLTPDRTFAVAATSSGSRLRDTRWIALKVKDAIADAQRARFRRRADVDPRQPDVPLRVWLHDDRATLLLDSSREPLDRRGYRKVSGMAPLREQLAAALVLASGWDGEGPVVDPMCGTGTLLIEAAWIALDRAPGALRESWVFERWPGFDAAAFARVRDQGSAAARDVAAHASSPRARPLERRRAGRPPQPRGGGSRRAGGPRGRRRLRLRAAGRARADRHQPRVRRAARDHGRRVAAPRRPAQAALRRLALRRDRGRALVRQAHRAQAEAADPGQERPARRQDPGVRSLSRLGAAASEPDLCHHRLLPSNAGGPRS